jgi:glucose-6-phosphate 1-dehydrogenase
LFASNKEVLASWAILQPILDHWSFEKADLKKYKPGSPVEKILKTPL